MEVGEDNLSVTQGGVNGGLLDDTQSREELTEDATVEATATASEDEIAVPEYIINQGDEPDTGEVVGSHQSVGHSFESRPRRNVKPTVRLTYDELGKPRNQPVVMVHRSREKKKKPRWLIRVDIKPLRPLMYCKFSQVRTQTF